MADASREIQKLFDNGFISREEYKTMMAADRRLKDSIIVYECESDVPKKSESKANIANEKDRESTAPSHPGARRIDNQDHSSNGVHYKVVGKKAEDDDGNDDSLEPLMLVDPTKNSVPDASASSWLATWPGPVV